MSRDVEKVRSDFDEIAVLTGESGSDRYDTFIAGLVPAAAVDVLDVGCGAGRLSRAVAMDNRRVTGIDLSPMMIAAAQAAGTRRVSVVCGDFLAQAFGAARSYCV